MLDIKTIREETDRVRRGADAKGITVDLDAILRLDARRRELLLEIEKLRQERNVRSKQIGERIKAGEAPAAGGWKSVTFAPTKPLPSYLVAFAVGPFEIVDAGKHGQNKTPIRIIVPKGKSAEAKYAAETTGKYKMALQVVAITMLILEGTALSEWGNLHLAGSVTLYLSLVLGYVSGGVYVWSFWKQVIAKGL